jgi:hypothetical protein
VGIPKAVRHVVSKLAECGWLYNKVKNYVQSRSTDKAFGLIGQVSVLFVPFGFDDAVFVYPVLWMMRFCVSFDLDAFLRFKQLHLVGSLF